MIASRLQDDHGTTLLEVLVALAIIALASGLSYPYLDRALRSPGIDDVANDVARLARQAGVAALVRERPQSVIFDMTERTVTWQGSSRIIRLPGTWSMELLTAEQLLIDTATAQLLLLPDGRSSGGELLVRDGKQGEKRVLFGWRTGGVTVAEGGR